jgi:hypothetical protein
MAKKSTGKEAGTDDTPVEQSETVIKAKQPTRAAQPKTKIKAKQPTRVTERVTVIQKEHPQGTKWLGASPWVVIGGAIAVALLVFLPVFPAEKTVAKTETVMVPVTKEREEQVTTNESIKTYQGYMVEQRGGDIGPVTGTTAGTGWSGTWQPDNCPACILTITQNGNQVTGSYFKNSNDILQIAGTVSGYQCMGRWSGPPSYKPDDAGEIEFTLAPDGQSMTGRWKRGSGGWQHTCIRTGPGTGTGMGIIGTGTGTGTITIDAVAEIVEVQRSRGPGDTWVLTLTAHDGMQTVYRNIVRDDLTKTGKATVSVTKTVSKPYTEQVPKEVVKQQIVKFRVNLISMVMQDY